MIGAGTITNKRVAIALVDIGLYVMPIFHSKFLNEPRSGEFGICGGTKVAKWARLKSSPLAFA